MYYIRKGKKKHLIKEGEETGTEAGYVMYISHADDLFLMLSA